LLDIWIEKEQNEKLIILYIRMELCDESLEEFIEELQSNRYLFRYKSLTPLGYYIACHIFVEILKGVNYLHTRDPQILHMDLHSGNILLKGGKYEYEPQIEVKLADFGLAKICEFAQKSQTISSKRSSNHSNYKSLSDGSYSPKGDIQCLGEIMNQSFIIERYLLLFCFLLSYFEFY
jgi:serine/threonine protein kinase